MPDIFVSYATADREVAFRIVSFLEAEGIECWVAPRDVAPGVEYGQAIINAIEQCKALVLVLSDQSNDSQFVRKEVERAVSKTKAVLPVRIREVTPSGSLEFYISSAQWVDAWKSPMEQHLLPLVAAIKAMSSPGAAPVRSASLSAQSAPSRSPSTVLMVIAAIAVLAAGIAGTLWYTGKSNSASTTTATPASNPAAVVANTAPALAASTPAPAASALAASSSVPATASVAAVPATPAAASAPAAPAAAAPMAAPVPAPARIGPPAPAAGPKRNDIAFVLGHWCQPYNGLTIRYEVLRTGADTVLTRVNHPQAPNFDVTLRVRPVAGGFDFAPADEPATDKNSSHFEIVDDTMMKLTRSEGEDQDGSIIRMRCAAE
jgi:hypothetical protein